MTWPVTLCLVRHAESEGNVLTVDERAKFPVATYNYKLTERGRKQAQITGEFLRQRWPTFDAYYTSYYRRAIETMELLYPGVKTYEDPRLAESQRGIYHTMSQQEIAEKYPEELKRKERENYFHYRAPGGENWADVELRIHSFLGTLSRDYEGQKVLIVVHGHWLICFQRLVERFSIDEAIRRYHQSIVNNASITTYQCQTINNRTRLVKTEDNVTPWLGKI